MGRADISRHSATAQIPLSKHITRPPLSAVAGPLGKRRVACNGTDQVDFAGQRITPTIERPPMIAAGIRAGIEECFSVAAETGAQAFSDSAAGDKEVDTNDLTVVENFGGRRHRRPIDRPFERLLRFDELLKKMESHSAWRPRSCVSVIIE